VVVVVEASEEGRMEVLLGGGSEEVVLEDDDGRAVGSLEVEEGPSWLLEDLRMGEEGSACEGRVCVGS
jgi:hypothetical protein